MPRNFGAALTVDDLRALIGVPERKRREYKECLPSGGDGAKEFINDVSSFANSDGGDLYLGISEDRETHGAKDLVGIPSVEAERAIARLESIVRDSIRPRLPYFNIQDLAIGGERVVLVLRIGESHLAPHQNTQNQRFYARNTNGKYPMEVGELRDMILRRESLPARIRAFRRQRVELIRERPEETPVPVGPPKKLVVHFVPIPTFGRFDTSFAEELAVNVPLRNAIIQREPIVTNNLGISYRPNLDGFLFMTGRADSQFPYYLQVFADGTVEFVETAALFNLTGEDAFGPASIERSLFQSYKFVRGTYEALEISGPFLVLTTLVGLRDSTMVLPQRYIPTTLSLVGYTERIGKDPAYLNEVPVDDLSVSPETALYPAIAQLWRAGGFSKPGSYSADGSYTGLRD